MRDCNKDDTSFQPKVLVKVQAMFHYVSHENSFLF